MSTSSFVLGSSGPVAEPPRILRIQPGAAEMHVARATPGTPHAPLFARLQVALVVVVAATQPHDRHLRPARMTPCGPAWPACWKKSRSETPPAEHTWAALRWPRHAGAQFPGSSMPSKRQGPGQIQDLFGLQVCDDCSSNLTTGNMSRQQLFLKETREAVGMRTKSPT